MAWTASRAGVFRDEYQRNRTTTHLSHAALSGCRGDDPLAEERVVYRSDGVVRHAELAYGSSILMLGQSRDDEYGRLIGDTSGRRTDSIYVAVKDPDALHAKAKAAGARIEMELHNTDYGSRDFACRDPEGNLWSFGTYWPKVSEKPLEG